MIHPSHFSSTSLFVVLTGSLLLACSPADDPSELIGEYSQAACSVPAPQDIDTVIRFLGQNGDACMNAGTVNQCYSYTDVRPVAVSVGDDHASASELYLCTNMGGQLDNCGSPPPQGYGCIFGGNCTCNGGVDCFLMVWNAECEPNTLECDDDSCTCEYVDGC